MRVHVRGGDFAFRIRVFAVRAPKVDDAVRLFRIERAVCQSGKNADNIIERDVVRRFAFVKRFEDRAFGRKRLDTCRRLKESRIGDLSRPVGINGSKDLRYRLR